MTIQGRKICLALSAALGFLSVLLGAAADHLLASAIHPDHLKAFETGLRYHQLYSLLLTALCLFSLGWSHTAPWLARTIICFLTGTLIFCGSLYGLSLTGIAALGYITPLGGLLLMSGWLCLGLFALTFSPPEKS